MKKILVIYYSQTGQSRLAIDSITSSFENNLNYKIDYHLIEPIKNYPYPWKFIEFCDIFPESVKEIPCEINAFKSDSDYDLIILGYQPWFLSICQPVNSFLQSEQARELLRGKPIITVINCRNMWLGAQSKLKTKLKELNSILVGNVVFADHSSNIVSLFTVLAYELKGVKENFLGFLPKYGVNKRDLELGKKLSEKLALNLQASDYNNFQEEAIKIGLVNVKANLMILEGRGKVMFPIYASYILKKGSYGNPQRKTRVRIFGIVLPIAILILSPLITLVSRIAPVFNSKKMYQKMREHQSIN